VTRYASVLDLIGNTPVVDVSALSPRTNVTILAKLEGRNPAGSVKDRVARSLVDAAERDGLLVAGQSGQILIEPSSGNTGIALAMVCRLRGYHLKVVLPSNVSPERRQLLVAFGAEVIDSPGSEGSNGAVRLAQKLSGENPSWVFLYQYANPANPEAHYQTTGPEILADVPELTHFVAGLGTSGTLMGVGRYLKEHKPEVQIWAIEPPSGEMVDGLRNLDDGYVPPIFTDNHGEELLDRKVIVRAKESIEWTRRMTEVGLFVGLSSGAVMAGAVKCALSVDEGESATIVVIIADDGWKYLSTGAWSDDVDDVVERAKATIYF
jgi:cysteine synthase B